MGLDPALKTQLHLRQAFPVILSNRRPGMNHALTKTIIVIQISIRGSAVSDSQFILFVIRKCSDKTGILRQSSCFTAENDPFLDEHMQNAAKCWYFPANEGEEEAKIKVRDNNASDNHCFSQSAIKNPRMPNQARLQSYTNQHIPASDLLLQQQTTSDDKTGNEGGIYDTGATLAKDRDGLESILGDNPSPHLHTWW